MYLISLPGKQAKIRVCRVGAGGNQFGCGLLRYGVDQQVLHRGKEKLGGFVGLVVVAAEGKQVAHFLIEALFRGPNIADAAQHLVEVIRAAVRVLQPLVVHDKALDQILFQHGGGPAAKLHATRRAHAVADGENGVEVVERDRALHLAAAFNLNCQGFLDSCRWIQLPVFEDVL